MEEKIYLQPGMRVQLRQDIANKPIMVVEGKVTNRFIPNKDEAGKDYLQGFECIWFSSDMKLQSGIFSTKDLIIID